MSIFFALKIWRHSYELKRTKEKFRRKWHVWIRYLLQGGLAVHVLYKSVVAIIAITLVVVVGILGRILLRKLSKQRYNYVNKEEDVETNRKIKESSWSTAQLLFRKNTRQFELNWMCKENGSPWLPFLFKSLNSLFISFIFR